MEVDVGLDISTSSVGVCILDQNGKVLEIYPIKLTSKEFDDLYDKANTVAHIFRKIANSYRVRRIFVEEAHMKFAAGKSSAQTIATLTAFNGIVCYICYLNSNIKPNKVNVNTARKVLKIKVDRTDKSISNKEKVFRIVKELNPELPWITHVAKSGNSKGKVVYDKENYDMADAWVIGRAGQIIF